MQQRDVAGLAGEDRLGCEREQCPAAAARRVPADPGLEGLRVPLASARRRPRGVGWHSPGQGFQPRLGSADVGQDQRVDPRDRAGISAPPAVEVQDRLAGVIGRERAYAKLGGQGENAILGRPGVLAAHLDNIAVPDRLADDPAADPVPGLQHHHRAPRLDQVTRCGKTCQASPDDDHVGRCAHLPIHRRDMHRSSYRHAGQPARAGAGGVRFGEARMKSVVILSAS
jgi:hypothetical protein